MFVRRFHVTDGATTTADGVVRASNKCSSLNGAAMALEGDPVDCPACGARGVIKCVMPRLNDCYGDKQYALSDDLCICGCNPPPKLIANQSFKYQALLCMDEGPAVATAERQAGDAAKDATSHAGSEKQADLRPLRFVMRGTCRPYANQPYRLDLADGKVVQGTTDANGLTKPLSPDEGAALRTWRSGQR
jgi:uncharacterized Zn-binding protein involved in type VI secretion